MRWMRCRATGVLWSRFGLLTGAAGRKGVAVTVADNGSGMDREMRDRLFHPFATTKGEAGTGLGLWVSKGILDKHNTTIAVRSKPGCGTVFRLFVPVETMESEGTKELGARELGSEGARERGSESRESLLNHSSIDDAPMRGNCMQKD